MDVGQGDAILITAPNKNQVLIDGGPDKKVLRALGGAMPFFDRTLDLILVTHPDLDHIGGLPDVFERLTISAYLSSPATSENPAYETLQKKIVDEKAQRILAQKGMRIILDDGVVLEILNQGMASSNLNAGSVVARLSCGEVDFLLMGDAPASLEERLAYQLGSNLRSEVLKVGHHGAKTSSAEFFLKKVWPEFAVISVGEDNRYGHPHAETLSRLEAIGAKILQTKDSGSIILKTNGQSLLLE